MRRILVPLDATAFSRHALACVRELIDPRGSEVVLMHVAAVPEAPAAAERGAEGWSSLLYEPAPYRAPDHAQLRAFEAWEHARRAAQDSLRQDAEALRGLGFEVEVVARFGEPVDEIARLCDEERFDLVVLATHGRTGLARVLRGSVAASLLQRIRVPVLAVRPDESDAPLVHESSLEPVLGTAGTKPETLEGRNVEGSS